MGDFSSFGRILVYMGLFIVAVGLFLIFFGRFGLGKLPGDIVIRRENFTFYFPLGTSILLSILLTILLSLFRR